MALGGRALGFSDQTLLIGSLPELDSMAVVAVLTAIEERFDCVIGDDEVDAAVFATVGSLIGFVTRKSETRDAGA